MREQTFVGLWPVDDFFMTDASDADRAGLIDFCRQETTHNLADHGGQPLGAPHALLIDRDRLAQSRWGRDGEHWPGGMLAVYYDHYRWFVLTLMLARRTVPA